MELIPIIEATLTIFIVFTTFFIIVSYTLYKLRGKSKEEPYVKELASDNLISLVVEKSVIVEDESEKIKRHERFKVVNPFKVPELPNKPKEKPTEMIKVYNTAAQSFNAANVIKKSQKINNSLNIYNLYSNSSIRPMHKLHTSEIS